MLADRIIIYSYMRIAFPPDAYVYVKESEWEHPRTIRIMVFQDNWCVSAMIAEQFWNDRSCIQALAKEMRKKLDSFYFEGDNPATLWSPFENPTFEESTAGWK